MASKHEIVKWQVITDWTKNKKGRLYCCNQGLAFPARKDKNGETVPSQFPLWFGPLKRKFKGFPDLFGFEIKNINSKYDAIKKSVSKFCTVEVKTKNDIIKKDQIRVMTELTNMFGVNCYIAKEKDDRYEMFLFCPDDSKKGYYLKETT